VTYQGVGSLTTIACVQTPEELTRHLSLRPILAKFESGYLRPRTHLSSRPPSKCPRHLPSLLVVRSLCHHLDDGISSPAFAKSCFTHAIQVQRSGANSLVLGCRRSSSYTNKLVTSPIAHTSFQGPISSKQDSLLLKLPGRILIYRVCPLGLTSTKARVIRFPPPSSYLHQFVNENNSGIIAATPRNCEQKFKGCFSYSADRLQATKTPRVLLHQRGATANPKIQHQRRSRAILAT